MKHFSTLTALRWILFIGFLFSFVHVCESLCDAFHDATKCQVCNSTVLICRDGKFENLTDILKRVDLLTLKYVEITGNDLRELDVNVFGSCASRPDQQLKDLTYLDLSNNNISVIHGKTFHCMPNLAHLKLGDNRWYLDNHTGIFSSLLELKSLNLSNAFAELGIKNTKHITKLSWMFNRRGELENLERLYLDHNGLYILPDGAQQSLCSLPSLSLLDLSHNYLIDIGLPSDTENGTKPCLKNLQVLKLSSNRLSVLSKPFRERLESFHHLKSVTLKHNRFDCDCKLREFLLWLNSTPVQIKHKNELLCYTGFDKKYINQPILNMTQNELRCGKPFSDDTPVKTGQIVVGILLGIIACVLIGVAFWNRHRIMNCFKRMPNVSYLSPGKESQFAYSSVEQTTNA